ncbi:MAG: HDIG domain-containing protein [Planctomycetaceae bacterium]|nr:HDIG domain-containing protein [Planctomycetaceae bacterium]
MSSSTGNPKRTRSDRVATLKLPPGTIERAIETIRRGDVLLRVSLCIITAFAVWAITGGWNPPFAFRTGDVPSRNVIARVNFSRVDEDATRNDKNEKRRLQDCVYTHDPRNLVELQQALKDRVFQLKGATSFEDVDKALWSKFSAATSTDDQDSKDLAELNAVNGLISSLASQTASPSIDFGPGQPITKELRKRVEFEQFKKSLADDPNLDAFVQAVRRSLAEFEENGLLENLQHGLEDGNQSQILIEDGNDNYLRIVEADKVRIGQVIPRLEANLKANISSPTLAAQVFTWLKPQLKTTLQYDREKTRQRTAEIIDALEPKLKEYLANKDVLADAGVAMTPETIALLRDESKAFVDQLDHQRFLYFSTSKFGMYLAIYMLCGFYIFFRRRRILTDIGSLAKLLALVFATVSISWFAAPSRFELIPLLLFSMTVVILYQQELALLLSASVAVVCVLSLGYGLMDLVMILASMATAILLLRHVRSRTKLIYVGLLTAVATFFTAIGVGTLSHFIDIAPAISESMGSPVPPAWYLLVDATIAGGCAIAAGLVLTGLLPFIEKFFGVQTDLSLLELGDPAHPLLQELVRRAPGTYNHSINVASIAQAAAESINANGLLVRVGAYYHDIGKMLKPGYFVENQQGKDNCHETLLPAMSTLVIIAHVKDGADLARQHNLPDSIIDFIQQHHGTTLVEYFYRRANEQKESDPEAAAVDEGSYRYPGPKPQTREAAVLMLADAVESAARTLVEPAPARIESLVEDISMKRLLDGQFDECGLTLRELRTIQNSLVKSVAAVYHGRIKYQDQQTA